MKIKLYFGTVLLFVLLSTQLYSQGIYLNFGSGYSLCAAPKLTQDKNHISNSDGVYLTDDYKLVKGSGSFGKGIQVNASIGYMFNSNIGAELGIGYLIGSKTTDTYKYTYQSTFSEIKSSMSGNMIRLSPALKITKTFGNIKPYMRTGLVIGVAPKLTEKHKSEMSTFAYSIIETQTEYTGGIALGFSGSLGADYSITDKIGIFAEFSVINQSWAPKKSKYTKYLDNGTDQLPVMNTSAKETEYFESFYTDIQNPDHSSPLKQLKQYYPFSSVGLNFGLHLNL